MSPRWFRRLLSLCPVAIALLWVAGVAHFRDYAMHTDQWLVVVAAAFALHVLLRRLRPPRPLPPLPEGASPVALSAIAALIFGVLALVIGGAVELLVEPYQPSKTSIFLRSTWHAACAFAAGYCTLLLRLYETRPKAPPLPPVR